MLLFSHKKNFLYMLVDLSKHDNQLLVMPFFLHLHDFLELGVRFPKCCNFLLLKLHFSFEGLQFIVFVVTYELASTPHTFEPIERSNATTRVSYMTEKGR